LSNVADILPFIQQYFCRKFIPEMSSNASNL